MNPQEEIRQLRESLKRAESVQAELDLRVFNLKTLYDVSKDIYGSVEAETTAAWRRRRSSEIFFS